MKTRDIEGHHVVEKGLYSHKNHGELLFYGNIAEYNVFVTQLKSAKVLYVDGKPMCQTDNKWQIVTAEEKQFVSDTHRAFLEIAKTEIEQNDRIVISLAMNSRRFQMYLFKFIQNKNGTIEQREGERDEERGRQRKREGGD